LRSSVIESGPPPWRADKLLVCTYATFRFAVDKFGIEKFDDRLVASLTVARSVDDRSSEMMLFVLAGSTKRALGKVSRK